MKEIEHGGALWVMWRAVQIELCGSHVLHTDHHASALKCTEVQDFPMRLQGAVCLYNRYHSCSKRRNFGVSRNAKNVSMCQAAPNEPTLSMAQGSLPLVTSRSG